MKERRRFIPLYLMLMLLLAACARMGNPDGGWYDETPPRITHTSPMDKSFDVNTKKINIYFDEFVKVADVTQNVIVSPPQMELPDIKSKGKKIVIELKDSLKPNTTYTVDFSDAITDNNEDNPLGNYTYSFSTGDHIDTLQVSGYVLNAADLEPIKSILVGLYDNFADTIFRKSPLLRVARTDAQGHFTIKGVAPGAYRIYALQDADDNYMFTQKSEWLAFTHDTIRPSVTSRIRQDTIWRDALHIDSISRVSYQHFLPDDIVLMAFQEVQTNRYLIKTERKEYNHIDVFFSYGSNELPVMKGLNFNADDAFIIESNAKKDSISYWMRDTALVNQDTLRFALKYEMTDTLGKLVIHTDTIEALAKVPYAKRLKAQQKDYEEWQKEQEKKKKREEPYDSIYPVKVLEPEYTISPTMDPDNAIFIEMPTPLAKLDTAAIHLYSMIDSLWYRAPFVFRQCDATLRKYELIADWQYEREYSFEVDSAAFVDIYGLVSNEYKQGIRVKSLDDYASILLQISGVQDTNICVQLIDKQDKVLKQAKTDKNHTAQFFFVDPGKYYLRAFVDRNNNGIWDTGNYDEDLQPESMFYYPGTIEAKAKWDLTQQWNLTDRPLNRQKPSDLVKQKSEKKKTVKGRNAERAQQLGIKYVNQQK